MAAWPLRFIHASDLHLEQPAYGIAELPDHLRDTFLDAPFAAARGVFDAACHESIEFLLLAGDVLSAAYAGPRAVVFLLEQFERLAERGVAVYWIAGRVDDIEPFADAVSLPPNVSVFPRGEVVAHVHRRDGEPRALVIGQSREASGKIRLGDFRPDPSGLFSIAMTHGRLRSEAIRKQRVNYLALGGRHQRRSLAEAPLAAQYSGSPQGRYPGETGAHGCTLVEIDAESRTTTRFIAADVLRWIDEHVQLDSAATREDLEAELRNRMERLIHSAPDRTLLIRWTISAGDALSRDLRTGGLADEMLFWLQSEYGAASPAAWSHDFAADASAGPPAACYQQDTILGDFLRLARDYQSDQSLELDLEPYVSARHLSGVLGDFLQLDDRAKRKGTLQEVARLGADLLAGGSPES